MNFRYGKKEVEYLKAKDRKLGAVINHSRGVRYMAKKVIHLLFCFLVFAAAAKDDKEFPTIYGFPIVSVRETVYGPQISCWTFNENLYGIQISPVLGLSVECVGLQAGLGNLAKNLRGVQVGLFMNEVQESACGMQIGLFNLRSADTKGIFAQIGLLNLGGPWHNIESVWPILYFHW